MKICVTGAEGFIGSHLVEKLVKSGHSVKALVLYNSFNDIGNLKFIDKKKLSKLNNLNSELLNKVQLLKYY